MALQYVHAKKREMRGELDRYRALTPAPSTDWPALERTVLHHAQGHLSRCAFAVYAEAGLVLGACGELGETLGEASDNAHEIVATAGRGGRKISYLNCFLLDANEPLPDFDAFELAQGNALAAFFDALYGGALDAFTHNPVVEFSAGGERSQWRNLTQTLRLERQLSDVFLFQHGRVVARAPTGAGSHARAKRQVEDGAAAHASSPPSFQLIDEPKPFFGAVSHWISRQIFGRHRPQSDDDEPPPSPPAP